MSSHKACDPSVSPRQCHEKEGSGRRADTISTDLFSNDSWEQSKVSLPGAESQASLQLGDSPSLPSNGWASGLGLSLFFPYILNLFCLSLALLCLDRKHLPALNVS